MSRFDFSGFDFFSNNSSKKNVEKRRRGRSCRIEELEGREMLSVSPWSLASDNIDYQPDFVQTEAPQVNEEGPGTILTAPVGPALTVDVATTQTEEGLVIADGKIDGSSMKDGDTVYVWYSFTWAEAVRLGLDAPDTKFVIIGDGVKEPLDYSEANMKIFMDGDAIASISVRMRLTLSKTGDNVFTPMSAGYGASADDLGFPDYANLSVFDESRLSEWEPADTITITGVVARTQLANPTNVVFTNLDGGWRWTGGASFSWDAVAGATGYSVRYSYTTTTGATFTSTPVASSDGTSHTFMGLSSWHTDGSFIVSWMFDVMAVMEGASDYNSGWTSKTSDKLQYNGNGSLGDCNIDVRSVTSDSITFLLEFNTTHNIWGLPGGFSTDCDLAIYDSSGNRVNGWHVAQESGGDEWRMRAWETVTGLTAGMTYTIVVTSSLPGYEAMVWTATATTKTLGTVSGVATSGGGPDGSIKLTWTEAGMDNATGVYIYYRVPSAGTGDAPSEFFWSAPIFVAKGTGEATLENLVPGLEYQFRVCPTDGVNQFDPVTDNSNGYGGVSASVTGTPNGALVAPAKPAGLSLAGSQVRSDDATKVSINISWGTVAGATNYRIQWRVAGTEAWTTDKDPSDDNGGANWNTGDRYPGVKRLNGFTVGETYEIQVCAVNGAGESAWSDTLSFTAGAVTPTTPGTPTVVSKTNTSVTLSWEASANGLYNVQYRTVGGDWVMANNGRTAIFPQNTATITGLTPSTEYEFRVIAVGFTRYSGWSGVSAAVTTNALASLGTFDWEILDVTDTTIKWSMSINLDLMPLGEDRAFYLLRGDDPTKLLDQWLDEDGHIWVLEVDVVGGGGWGGLDNVGEVHLTATELEPGVNYTVVYMFNKEGYTPIGVYETVRTIGADMDGNVTVTATAVEKVINVSWVGPTTPTDADYFVTVKKDGSVVPSTDYVITGTGTSRTITGLAPGTYTIEVTAEAEGYNHKTGSDTATIVDTQLPAPVVTPGAVTTSSVALSWTAVSKAVGYEIQYSTDGVAWVSVEGTVTGTSKVVAGLDDNTEYQFQVRALAAKAEDNSEWSESASKKTEAVPRANKPTNFAVDGTTATTLGFKWDTVDGLDSSADGYFEIRYSSDAGKSWTVVKATPADYAAPTFTVLNLSSQTPYTVEVRSVKTSGSGASQKVVVVSEWADLGATKTVKTDGTAQNTPDKKSKPAKVKVGNGKGAVAKPAIDTIFLELPDLSTQKQAGAVSYVIEIDITKLPKKWNGVTLDDAGKAALVKDATISIVGNVATISGLPAGLKVPFIVKTVDGSGQLSAPMTLSASTAKYAATKIKGMKNADAPTLTTIKLQPTPPKVVQDTAFDVSYEIVVSYVAKVGTVKTTFYSTFTIAKKNNEDYCTEVPGEAGTGKGGFKGATAPIPAGVKVAIDSTGNIKFSGLPFAGTKYAFALRTIAEDVYGNKNFSAVAKASVSTAKYNAVKLAKPAGSALTWTDPKPSAETTHFVVYTSADKKGATVDTVLAVNTKLSLTADVGATKGTVFVVAVVLKDGVDIADFNAVKSNILYQSAAAKATVK